jgi:SAM-dependent MidA family methyltransferase
MAQALGVPAADFTVVELGAGGGLLARDILQHIPCRYRIVERSAAMRQRQRALLEGRGVEWVEDLPERLVGCVFSNEFFDALPVRRLVGRGGGLREIFVDENFNEVEREPAEPPNLPLAEGQLVDYAPDAAAWIGRIARSLACGYHLAIDYGYLDREFYARPRGTLMCYRRHRLSEDPYAYVGEQDITAHVNFAELMRAGEAAGLVTHAFSTQMDYLVRMGVLDEIEALAPLGTAASISRIAAIKTLLLPGGMGERFKVLVQRTR